MTITALAGMFLWVRELTNRQNNGPMVEAMLRFVGLPRGNPWCAAFVSFVLALYYGGKSPLPATASCQVIYDYAKKHNLIVDEPEEGYVFLLLDAKGHAHHTGFCAGKKYTVGLFPTIEGNTNVDGSRDGYGVFERERKLAKNIVIVKTD